MKKVFVAGRIPQEGLERLQKAFEVELYDHNDLISEAELRERLKDKDALLSLLSTPVSKETIDSAPNLKVIANFGAGYNNIDFEYAGEKGIYVTNTPEISTDATADLTCSLRQGESPRVMNYAERQASRAGRRYFSWAERSAGKSWVFLALVILEKLSLSEQRVLIWKFITIIGLGCPKRRKRNST